MKTIAVIVGVAGILALGLAFYALMSWVFEVAWNWVVPSIFHLTTITFWESAVILLLLCIIGSFFKRSRD